MLLGLFGHRVDDGYDSIYAGLLHRFADKVIEFGGADKREEAAFILAFVAVQNFDGSWSEIDFYYSWALFFRFARDVMDCYSVFVCHDIVFREGEEVADSAPDIALKYKYITRS